MNKQTVQLLKDFTVLPDSERRIFLTMIENDILASESSPVIPIVTPQDIGIASDDNIHVGSLVKIKDSARTISTKWKKKTFKVIKRSRVRLWLEIPGSEKPLYPLITDCDLVQ
jgi:hypothetical protein